MSAPVQGRSGRGYGKVTQYPPGNKYGHCERNFGGSRRENIPPFRHENFAPVREKNIPFAKHENICPEPPLWLDSYLQEFKKVLISEMTDNVMRAFDNSYKNEAEKRRYKAKYFALRKHSANLEAQQNAGNSQQHESESQSSPPCLNNDKVKTEEKKTQEKFNHPCNSRKGSYNKQSNEPATSSLNGTNANSNASSSVSNVVNGHEKLDIEAPACELVSGKIADSTQMIENTSPPSIIMYDHKANEDMKTIGEENPNVEKFSQEPTCPSGPSDHTANEKHTSTESTQPLKEIFKLLDDGESENQSSITAEHLTNVSEEIDKTLCQKVQSMLNKLTLENFDVMSKQVEDLVMDTPEKQQEVINVFFDRARHETMYSVVYARMCKKFAVEHKCILAFREMLTTQCDIELMYHKETEKKKIKEFDDSANGKGENVEIDAESDQKNSNEFLGALLFMGELYNQDLLTDTVIDKCLQYLLQNGTESGLRYLCHVLQLVGKILISRDRAITPYMNHLVESRESSALSPSLIILINSLLEFMSNSSEPLVPDGSSETTDFKHATDE